jgi:hypothetical protein
MSTAMLRRTNQINHPRFTLLQLLCVSMSTAMLRMTSQMFLLAAVMVCRYLGLSLDLNWLPP